jgi:uncharacterized protein YeaO (DUF488 family)
MAIRIVRLGSPRHPGEGLRIGTVRRPPRGVKKEDYASRNYFDSWLPELAPSASIVTWGLSEPWTPVRWRRFERLYRAEMNTPEKQRLLRLFAALSKQTDFSVGCYCENESFCHRSVLGEMLRDAGAELR